MKKLFLALLACVAAITAVSAHAFLDHAEPKVGAAIHHSPVQLKIWFTEKLILPFSTVKVTDASGAEVDQGDKHLDPADGQLLLLGLKPLKAGKYKVEWRVTAIDTHVTNGAFSFDVAP